MEQTIKVYLTQMGNNKKLQEQAGLCDAVRCHGGAVFAGVHCVCARRGYLLRHLIFKYIIYR